MVAVKSVIKKIEKNFGLKIEHQDRLFLREIVSHLRAHFPDINFKNHFDNTFLKPDGGFVFILDKTGKKYTILISEAKRQGTNDLRVEEGLDRQAKGNAIERLGKNLIGFKSWLASENILPFVAFGEGVDFAPDSSILDRVSTMAMFAPLNTIEVQNLGVDGRFVRGSFYFREQPWKPEEMEPILYDIAERAIYYYFSKLGPHNFV